MNITNWKSFSNIIRRSQQRMILDASWMKDLIFVTGCQRSGTTALANIFLESLQVFDYRNSLDSELQGALYLSGIQQYDDNGLRSCFQTTYLNERYKEYESHIKKFKLFFVLRNPYSVVYSMVYNWKSRFAFRNFALNELFEFCGSQYLNESEVRKYATFGSWGFSSLRKACLSYVAKTRQIVELKDMLGDDCFVVDYDDLVSHKTKILPHIFNCAALEYEEAAASLLHAKSSKKAELLSDSQREAIHDACWETYELAKQYISPGMSNG